MPINDAILTDLHALCELAHEIEDGLAGVEDLPEEVAAEAQERVDETPGQHNLL